MDAPGHAAGEERRETFRTSSFTLCSIAVRKKLREETRRRAAERVPEQDQACIVIPCGDEWIAGEVAAEALVAHRGAVRGPVIDARARNLRIELAGSVPRAAERIDGSGVAVEALSAQDPDVVTDTERALYSCERQLGKRGRESIPGSFDTQGRYHIWVLRSAPGSRWVPVG